MKAALVVLAVVAVVAVCDARRWRTTTTEEPCAGQSCGLRYEPVCVQDPSGAYFLFSDRCMLRACRCRTEIDFTEMDDPDDCPADARTKCPDLWPSSTEGYGRSLEGSDSSDSSDDISGRRPDDESW